MSFPLGSLGAPSAALRDGGSTPAPGAARWRLQFAVVFGGVLWLLALLALVTHDGADRAWSTSGLGAELHNRVGVVGAWFSDIALFLLGHSAGWLLAIAGRAWLGALARWLRADLAPGRAAELPRPGWLAPLGVVLLLAASCALEWTRLYGGEAALPSA